MRATTQRLHAAGCAIGRPLLLLVDQEGGYARRLTWAAPEQTARELRTARRGANDERGARHGCRAHTAGIDVDSLPSPTRWYPAASSSRSFGSILRRSAGSPRRSSAGCRNAASPPPRSTSPASARRTGTPTTTRCDSAGRSSAPSKRDRRRRQLVMVASAAYPLLDPTGTPAVFSRPIVTGLLREKLGFDGVVVTDALDARRLPALRMRRRGRFRPVSTCCSHERLQCARRYVELARDHPRGSRMRSRACARSRVAGPNLLRPSRSRMASLRRQCGRTLTISSR